MQSETYSRFIQHYSDLLDSFHFYFNRSRLNPEIEDLHNLRVSIKKLRAMWSLLQTVSNGSWKKKEHFELISELFRATGKVRETQVNLIITEKYNADYLVAFNEYLAENQVKAEEKLRAQIQVFNPEELKELDNKMFHAIKEQRSDMEPEQLISFVLKETRKVDKLSKQLPSDRKLHKIRIRLKAVAEILTIASELNPHVVLIDFLDRVRWLNEFIGDWHDYQILLSSITDFLSSGQKEQTTGELEDFIARTTAWQDKKQVEITVLLDRSISHQQMEQIENCL